MNNFPSAKRAYRFAYFCITDLCHLYLLSQYNVKPPAPGSGRGRFPANIASNKELVSRIASSEFPVSCSIRLYAVKY